MALARLALQLVQRIYSGLQSSCNFRKSEKRSFPVFPSIFQVLHMRSFVFRFFDLQKDGGEILLTQLIIIANQKLRMRDTFPIKVLQVCLQRAVCN